MMIVASKPMLDSMFGVVHVGFHFGESESTLNSTFESRFAVSPTEAKQMNTENLRENFLIETVFKADELRLTLSHFEASRKKSRLQIGKQRRTRYQVVSSCVKRLNPMRTPRYRQIRSAKLTH